ncbi:MAG: N-acetyltransferase family protein [Bacteroidota bacterium]
MIRAATQEDAKAILNIYSYYVLNSHSTFELVPPSIESMKEKVSKSNYPWFVMEENDSIVGYAYATQWKPREAYSKTVETSVYLDHKTQGKGYGTLLYQRLIDELTTSGFHALLAGISLPNDASIRLHEKLGFEKVGQLKEVGFKFDRWIDVGYWELQLDLE